jgi:pimeloyl-ACP methyl ester carboxylesterase
VSPTTPLERKTLITPAHTTSYLDAGPTDGPLLVFVHGFPATGLTWRHQLEHFAALGFRAVAPDLRGYGGSSVHGEPTAYRQEAIVHDVLALLDHLGRRDAVWIGHDWGSPTVWNLAAHFPERTRAVATLAVPFGTLERGWDGLLATVDRSRYPADRYPYGQFDYMAYYERSPLEAAAVLDADPEASMRAIYRSGDPAVHTRPSPTATTIADGGRFGGAPVAPDLPLDRAILTEQDLAELAAAMKDTGLWGPVCYYLNHGANQAYAAATPNGGRLTLPVLLLGAAYDPVADLTSPHMLDAMHTTCENLAEATIAAGHWLQLEARGEVNEQLERWLRTLI